MSTRLPESLPYKYIDEYLDGKFVFNTYTYTDHEDVEWTAYSAQLRDSGRYRGNYARQMIGLVDDTMGGWEEDEEGYINYEGSFGMVWRAEPLTEEELDFLLDEMD